MLSINPEFKKLIPPLTADEFQQLEANCLAEGIRDAIVVWNGYILDGHNRYEIAQKHGLEYRTVEKHFESIYDAKDWMFVNQLGRRNLNEIQISKLRGDRYNNQKQQHGGDRKSNGQNGHLNKTAEAMAKEYNVGENTIKRDADFATGLEHVTPELEQDILQGNVKVNKGDVQELAKSEPFFVATTKDELVKKANEIRKQKQEEKLQTFLDNANKFEKPIGCKNFEQEIILGDCLDVLPTLGKREYNLLLTDMPYGMDFKSGWSDKGKIANDTIDDTVKLLDATLLRVKPLLTVDAHFYIFGSINYIAHIRPIIEKYLTLKNILIWDRGVIGMGDLSTYGSSYDIVYFGYNKLWRKLNGVRDRDILSFNRIAPHKAVHPTEKPIELIEYLVRKSTNERDKVLDPFAGGGSTLVACKNINRFATGIELKEEYVNLIKTKI